MRIAWAEKIEQKSSLLEFLGKLFRPDKTNVLSHEQSECRVLKYSAIRSKLIIQKLTKQLNKEISGGDTFRGNTRSHPEHEG